jgi:hypothetical protein
MYELGRAACVCGAGGECRCADRRRCLFEVGGGGVHGFGVGVGKRYLDPRELERRSREPVQRRIIERLVD